MLCLRYGNLLNVKRKELGHQMRELSIVDAESDVCEDMAAETRRDIEGVHTIPDLNAEFEDNLVQAISFQQVLSELLQTLTLRERDVCNLLREDQQNYEIAEALNLFSGKLSWKPLHFKLRGDCKHP